MTITLITSLNTLTTHTLTRRRSHLYNDREVSLTDLQVEVSSSVKVKNLRYGRISSLMGKERSVVIFYLFLYFKMITRKWT